MKKLSPGPQPQLNVVQRVISNDSIVEGLLNEDVKEFALRFLVHQNTLLIAELFMRIAFFKCPCKFIYKLISHVVFRSVNWHYVCNLFPSNIVCVVGGEGAGGL